MFKYTLHKHQKSLFDDIRNAFRKHRSVLAVSATGSGKSIIMHSVVDSFLSLNKKFKYDRHIYFIVDEKFLLYQFSEHLTKTGIAHDIIGDSKREGRPVNCHVCLIQTLSKHHPKNEPYLFVIDEAHLSTSDRFMNLFEKYPDCKILGFTATDETSSGKGLSRESGNGIYDISVKAPVTMRELTEGITETDEAGVTTTETFLTPVKCYGIPIKGIETLHMQTGEYKSSDVDKLLKDRGTFGDAITEMRKFPDIQNHILFFCRSVAACYEMEIILHANNYTAEVLEGKLTRKERKSVMKNFSSSKTQVLITCKMVQKGADLPKLLMGVDIQPTPSRGTQRQKIGRLTRKAEGKEFAILLDMVGNHRVFPGGDIYAEWESNFDSTKYNKKPSGETQDQYCPLCYAYIPTGTKICPDCGAEKVVRVKKEKHGKHIDGELVEIAPVPLSERTDDDKKEVQSQINKALVDNDIEALILIGKELTTGKKLPFWLYFKLNDKKGIINIPLLYRIQRSLNYKSSWVYFAKKQIKLI
ncbi:DEAD/DEAH box helicase family protein [Candidatus Pacearchaeota archaeon]|nr:DEAD/DEAH box helicase family protein [Candidatus Pacearchaeota archaeon]